MEERNKKDKEKYKAALIDNDSQSKGVASKGDPDITTPSPPQVMNSKERLEKTEGVDSAEQKETAPDNITGLNKENHPFIPEPPGYENREEEDQNDPNPNSNPNYSYYPNVAYPTRNSSQDEEEA